MVFLFLFLFLCHSKLYISVPEKDLAFAKKSLCELTVDFKDALPDSEHEFPVCFPIHTSHKDQHFDDIQRAFSHYNNFLRERGFRVSFETEREYKKRIYPYTDVSGYKNEFCMELENIRLIKKELEC
jgi:hypothetical protein